jgi:hypothetical protein
MHNYGIEIETSCFILCFGYVLYITRNGLLYNVATLCTNNSKLTVISQYHPLLYIGR